MQQNDVGCAVCIGVNLENLSRVLALAEAYPHLLASVGVHPESTDVSEPTVAELVQLAAHPKVIAIGETGLDYYWHKDAPEWQRERSQREADRVGDHCSDYRGTSGCNLADFSTARFNSAFRPVGRSRQ